MNPQQAYHVPLPIKSGLEEALKLSFGDSSSVSAYNSNEEKKRSGSISS